MLAGPAIGVAAAAGVPLLGLLIVFAIADSRAEDAFFGAYAEQRGLALSGRGPLPAATPLLRRGDDRYAERASPARSPTGSMAAEAGLMRNR